MARVLNRRGWAAVVLAAVTLMAGSVRAAEWHVSPTGKPDGDGSAARPWDLVIALAQPTAVKPGDTILLAAGTYSGTSRDTFTSKLTGEPNKPIIVRPAEGAHAVIQPSLNLAAGGYVWFRDLEVMNPDTKEYARTEHGRAPAVWIRGTHDVKLINLLIHEGGQGIGAWTEAKDVEIYGCLIFNNGWAGSNQGHGIYTQNRQGTKRIADCIIFNTLTEGYGLHAYGSDNAFVDNFVIEGNILFHNGGAESLVGGGQPSHNIVYRNNYLWSGGEPKYRLARFGYGAPYNEDAVIRDNYFANRRVMFMKWNKLELQGNTFIAQGDQLVGLDPADHPRNTYLAEPPKGVKYFIRPNAYQPGRAHVAVYNWAGQDKVNVDLSKVLKRGQAFEVRDAQDFLGRPVFAGRYDGSPVALPMKLQSVQQPVTDIRHEHTPPEFNAFVVVPAGSAPPTSRPAKP